MEKGVAFIWTNLNPIHQCYFVPSLLSNCQVVLKMFKWIFNVVNVILFISLLSSFVNGSDPLFEQTWILFTQGYFVPTLYELCSVALDECLLFRHYLLLKRNASLHLIKLEFPILKNALCLLLLKLAQWFWRNRWKCEKFTDRLTKDNGWSEKVTRAVNSGELKSWKTGIDWDSTRKSL